MTIFVFWSIRPLENAEIRRFQGLDTWCDRPRRGLTPLLAPTPPPTPTPTRTRTRTRIRPNSQLVSPFENRNRIGRNRIASNYLFSGLKHVFVRISSTSTSRSTSTSTRKRKRKWKRKRKSTGKSNHANAMSACLCILCFLWLIPLFRSPRVRLRLTDKRGRVQGM